MWAIFVCFGFYIMKLSHEPRPLWRPRVSTRLPLQDVFHWKVKCVAPSLNTKSNPKLNLVSDTVSGIWSIGPHAVWLDWVKLLWLTDMTPLVSEDTQTSFYNLCDLVNFIHSVIPFELCQPYLLNQLYQHCQLSQNQGSFSCLGMFPRHDTWHTPFHMTSIL